MCIRDRSNSFTLKFTGINCVAEASLRRLMDSCKLPEGGFRQLKSLDPDGVRTQLFLNTDKNGCMLKTEGATKRFVKHIKALHADLDVFGRRSDGVISCERCKLARLLITEDKGSVEWHPGTVERFKIKREQILNTFLQEENIQWCP